MNLKHKIGQQVKSLRADRGLSQSDLGNKIGASKQYISGIESARKTCSIDRLQQIAEALGCELDNHHLS